MRFLLGAGLLLLAGSVAWLAYGKLQAEKEMRRLKYERLVLKVLPEVYAERFSLPAVTGPNVFRSPAGSMSPITVEEYSAASVAQRTNRIVGAVRELAGIAEDSPKADGHYHLARAYGLLERRAEARREVKRALDLDPGFLPAKLLQWELSLDTPEGEVGGLETIWSECKSVGGWRGSWLRAFRSSWEKRWDEAGAAYRELTDLDRQEEPYIGFFLEAYLGLGHMNMRLKEYEKARQAFSVAHFLAPGFEPTLHLGKAYYLDGKRPEAEETFTELYESAGPHEKNEAVLLIVGHYSLLGDHGTALEWAGKLQDFPARERLLASCFFRLGRTDEAIVAGRKAIACDRDDAMAHRILAYALLTDLWSRRRPDRAARLSELQLISRRALQLEPDSEWALALVAAAQAEMIEDSRSSSPELRTNVPTNSHGFGQFLNGYFGHVTKIAAVDVNSADVEWRPAISADGLEFYFQRFPAARGDLYVAARERSTDEAGNPVPFGPARGLDEINSEYFEGNPCISSDRRTLYFLSNRPDWLGGEERYMIHVATRKELGQPFGNVRPVELINTEYRENCPSISSDDLELYFHSDRPGGKGNLDLYVATRETADQPFHLVRNLEEINTPHNDAAPCISGDGRALFWSDFDPFQAVRPAGVGYGDMWMATRNKKGEPFGSAVNVGPPVNTAMSEGLPAISSDWPAEGSILYFGRCIPEDIINTLDFYQATWHAGSRRNGIEIQATENANR